VLWRLGLPQTAPALDLDGETLIEWQGAQRWLVSSQPAARIRAAAAEAGGHATLFRARSKEPGVFAPARATPLDRIHRQLKQSFDPRRVKPRPLYAGL
jgi:glycolate oxidase FAD binding subunit